MNELRVDIGGNTRGFQRATEEAVGIAKSSSAKIDDLNKKSAMAYEDFWQGAIAAKEAKEIEAAEAAALAQKEIAARTAAEIAAMNATISAGTMPGSWGGAAKGAAGGLEKGAEVVGDVGSAAYAFDQAGKLLGKVGQDGKLIKGAEAAAEGLADVSKAAHGSSTILRESMVIIREGLRGNFTRMIGSFSILIGAIGSVVAAALAVVGAADAVFELLGGNGIFRHVRDYMGAKSGEKESAKSLEEATNAEREVLHRKVEELTKLGKISDKQAEQLVKDMRPENGQAGLLKVMNVVNPLQKNGTAEEQTKQVELQKQAAEKARELQRAERAYRDELERSAEPQQKRIMLLEDEKELKDKIWEAAKARDNVGMIGLQTELLRKQAELKALDAKDQKAETKAAGHWEATHIDSMSSAGLMQSISAATSNPMLEVAKQQLHHLATIAHNTTKTGTQDPHAP